MKRICKYCGTTYEGDPGSSCCSDCAAKQRETTLRPRTCRTCGKTFSGGPRAWYCPDCRLERRREADRRRKKTGTQRPIGSTDTCEICGKLYVVNSARQRYCVDCAPQVYREKDRQASKDWNAANLTKEQRRSTRKAATAEIPCAVCGKPFRPHGPAITCSPECSAELKKCNAAKWEEANRKKRNAYHRNLRKKKTEK